MKHKGFPVLAILLGAFVLFWSLSELRAEPTEVCRTLAKNFSEDSDTLSVNELGALQSCVRVEHSLRILSGVSGGTAVPVPPPGPPPVPAASMPNFDFLDARIASQPSESSIPAAGLAGGGGP